ncbi:non-structural maintenance of chromosomes element 4 homolog A [Tanacetum coccineum]
MAGCYIVTVVSFVSFLKKSRSRSKFAFTCNVCLDFLFVMRNIVQKPRVQVADAEALADIINILVTSVKAQSNEGVIVGDFVSSLLRGFGRLGGENDGTDGSRNAVKLGLMNSEVKQRTVIMHKKHSRVTEKARPGEGRQTLLAPILKAKQVIDEKKTSPKEETAKQ